MTEKDFKWAFEAGWISEEIEAEMKEILEETITGKRCNPCTTMEDYRQVMIERNKRIET